MFCVIFLFLCVSACVCLKVFFFFSVGESKLGDGKLLGDLFVGFRSAFGSGCWLQSVGDLLFLASPLVGRIC